MKNTKTAQKVRAKIQQYIRYYQEHKRCNPPELVLSDYQIDAMGLRGDTLFGLPWRRYP